MERKTQDARRLMQEARPYLILLPFYFLLFLFFGCAGIKETAKAIAGVSTQALEEGRKEAISRQFNYDLNTCFSKSEAILKERDFYIYAKDLNKRMIAVYLSNLDTTAAGIFFKEIDAQNTLVEVSSASTYAKEAIAKKLFPLLEGKTIPQEEKGTSDAEKMGY